MGTIKRHFSIRVVLGTSAVGMLLIGVAGCGDITLSITQHKFINNAAYPHRPVDERTGDPLEVNIVCVLPDDLEKPENNRLKPGSGITSREWYDQRPTHGGQEAQKFSLPSEQIYVLSNTQGVYGVPKGQALQGAAEEKPERIVAGIKFPKKFGHRNSVIYVFPRFIGPDYEIIPTPPVAFNPPSKYGRSLAVEIGLQSGGSFHGQFIKRRE